MFVVIEHAYCGKVYKIVKLTDDNKYLLECSKCKDVIKIEVVVR